MSVTYCLTNLHSKEHDILLIINNKQEIYDRMIKYNIVEEHIEKNNYKFIFTINLQDKIQISFDSKEENIDMYRDVKKEIQKFMEGNIK